MNSDDFVDAKFSDSASDNDSNSSQKNKSETQNIIKVHQEAMNKKELYNSFPDIFAICKNNIPIGYCNNHKSAWDYILKLAWEEKGLRMLENSDYNYYITVESKSLVYLCCTFKNWLLSYDNTLAEFSYHEIKNLNK